jgi:hypothetical protein
MISFLASSLALLAAVSTEGWNNFNPGRVLREPVKEYWRAPFAAGAGEFEIEKCDGAEGSVEFDGASMIVRKTSLQGYIIVKSRRTVTVAVGKKLRSYADAEVWGADPNYSLALPRVLDSRKRLHSCFKLDAQALFMGGGEKIAYLANTAKGVAERRFSGFEVLKEGGSELVPALVIAGAPSSAKWVKWGVEDYDAAEGEWQKIRSTMVTDGPGKRNLEPEDEFSKMLSADFEHTAKIGRLRGRVALSVDGRDTVPVLYKNPGSWGLPWGDFNGRAMEREGIFLQSFEIGGSRHWTNGEWNVAAAVRDIRDMMRASPKALVMLSFGCSVPREYADRNPDELWRNPDGTPCVGTWGKMRSRHYSDPNKKPYSDGCWPWISHSSKKYESYMKGVLVELVGALKREGLSKRIVGVHFAGWHDGQFAPYRADFSEVARRGFVEFLTSKYGSAPADLKLPVPSGTERFFDASTAEGKLEYDFNEYLHIAPFRLQENLARTAKKAFGKDIVCIHYCMGVYAAQMNGAYYFEEFLKSDAMDGLVAQPSYVRRMPGNSVGNLVPLASFNRHGKLYVDELDLRAWGEIPSYVKEPSLGGLGFAMDIEEWQAINHKMAGRMIAADQGYWYFDISGGFYNPDPIERDIGESVRTYAKLRTGKKTPWRPSAAFVVDSKGMLWRNMIGIDKHRSGINLVNTQLEILGASSVPFEVWTFEDAAEEVSRSLASCKVVVLAGFHEMDEKRLKFISALGRSGKTVVLLAETGGFRDRMRKDGCDPYIQAEKPGEELDFMSRIHTGWERWMLGVPRGPLAIEFRPMSFAFAEREGTEVLARYRSDSLPAVIRRGNVVAIGQAAGLTPRFFNRLVREAGGYVPVEGGLQVDMNGDFVSVSALDNGTWDFALPFACEVENLKTGGKSAGKVRSIKLEMIAGETRWYKISR